MRAWQVHQFGDLRDAMTLTDVAGPGARPRADPRAVVAAPANFPDVLMCQGAYQVKPPLPFTPDVELCGEVVASGPGVTGFTGGERVIGAAG